MSANSAFYKQLADDMRQEQVKQNKSGKSVAEFMTQCDHLYIDAMAYIIKITLNPEIEDSQKMTAIGEVIANLYNAIIRLDPIQGERELAKHDST